MRFVSEAAECSGDIRERRIASLELPRMRLFTSTSPFYDTRRYFDVPNMVHRMDDICFVLIAW
jgi:hypothetical protein